MEQQRETRAALAAAGRAVGKPMPLGDVPWMPAEAVAHLQAAGVTTTYELLERGTTPEERAELSAASGIAEPQLLEWLYRIDLERVRGLGYVRVERLTSIGVTTVPDLARRSVETLYPPLLHAFEERGLRPPPRDEVGQWIAHAATLAPTIFFGDETNWTAYPASGDSSTPRTASSEEAAQPGSVHPLLAAAAGTNIAAMAASGRAYSRPIALSEVPWMDAETVVRFRSAGITTTHELLERGTTPDERAQLMAATGIAEPKLMEWLYRLDLERVRGLGYIRAERLTAVGVTTVPDLGQRQVESLYPPLVAAFQESNLRPPSQTEVGEWIAHARTLPPTIFFGGEHNWLLVPALGAAGIAGATLASADASSSKDTAGNAAIYGAAGLAAAGLAASNLGDVNVASAATSETGQAAIYGTAGAAGADTAGLSDINVKSAEAEAGQAAIYGTTETAGAALSDVQLSEAEQAERRAAIYGLAGAGLAAAGLAAANLKDVTPQVEQGAQIYGSSQGAAISDVPLAETTDEGKGAAIYGLAGAGLAAAGVAAAGAASDAAAPQAETTDEVKGAAIYGLAGAGLAAAGVAAAAGARPDAAAAPIAEPVAAAPIAAPAPVPAAAPAPVAASTPARGGLGWLIPLLLLGLLGAGGLAWWASRNTANQAVAPAVGAAATPAVVATAPGAVGAAAGPTAPGAVGAAVAGGAANAGAAAVGGSASATPTTAPTTASANTGAAGGAGVVAAQPTSAPTEVPTSAPTQAPTTSGGASVAQAATTAPTEAATSAPSGGATGAAQATTTAPTIAPTAASTAQPTVAANAPGSGTVAGGTTGSTGTTGNAPATGSTGSGGNAPATLPNTSGGDTWMLSLMLALLGVSLMAVRWFIRIDRR